MRVAGPLPNSAGCLDREAVWTCIWLRSLPVKSVASVCCTPSTGHARRGNCLCATRPARLAPASAEAAPLYAVCAGNEREWGIAAGSADAICALPSNAAKVLLLASLRLLVPRVGCSTTVAHGPWSLL